MSPDPSTRRGASRRLATGLALLLAGTLLAGCSGGNPTDAEAAGATSPSTASGDQAPVRNGAAQVAITLTGGDKNACSLDHASAPAGPVTFTVTNTSSPAITEVELQSDGRILGEKENLAPGLPAVSFTLTLGGGDYQIYCPGAATELQEFTVTGKAVAKPSGSVQTLLAAGAKSYGTYVANVIADMQTAVGNLRAAVDSGDVAKAKKAYALARPFYEKVESDVDGFVLPGFKVTDNAGNLDYLIDMRASNLDPKVGWHGFHAIERDLWQKGKITKNTKKLAAELETNVDKLAKLSKGLTYKPEDLANGAAGLLEEVQSGKIKGEEEAYSHLDLVDFAANVEGAQQAFENLKPGLTKIDPALTKRIEKQFDAVNKALEKYQDNSQPGGYILYTKQVRAKNAASLSRTVQALQTPLSKIAEKVATAQ